MSDSGRVLVVGPDSDARARVVTAAETTRDELVVDTTTAAAALDGRADVVCLVCRHGDGVDARELLADVQPGADGLPVVVVVDPDGDATAADLLDAGAAAVVREQGDWESLLATRIERAIEASARADQPDCYETYVEAGILKNAELEGYREHLETVLDGESEDERVELDWGADETLTSETRLTPIRDNGEVDGAVAITRDVTERAELERELRENQRRLSAIVENTRDPIFIKNRAGEYVFANEATAAQFGLTVDELLGKTDADLFDETAAAEIRADDQRVIDEREPMTAEAEREYDGEQRIFQTNKFPYTDEDEGIVGVVGIARDVTERRRVERQLRESEQGLRDLYELSARTDLGFEEKVAHILDVGRKHVGLEAAFLATVDPAVDTDEAGFQIVVDDGNDELFSTREPEPLSETYCRKTVEQDEPLLLVDAVEEGWEDDPAYEKYGLGCYMGGKITVDGELYGTLCFTGREPREEPFTESQRHFLELLTQWLSYELERREREERLQQLLTRINGLIYDVVEILVEGSTREEIADRVCDRLAAVEGYELAWLGDVTIDGDDLAPTVWAGNDGVDLGDVAFPFETDQSGPEVRAVTERAAQLQDLVTDPPSADWPLGRVDTEFRAVIAVPLVYRDTDYGVLAVYGDDRETFDEREQVVLSALGRAIANAYNAIETGRILGTDQVIELELTVADDDLLENRIAATAGVTLTDAGSVYQPDGSLRVFYSTDGGDAEAVVAAAADQPEVVEAGCLADDEEGSLFEFVVEDALVAMLADHGAVTRHLESDGGRARLTVELPGEADARDLFDVVEDNYGNVDLVAYHEHDRPVETRQEFRAALEDRLTDRQRTALQSAFLSGFFEWPRPVSGDELATSMDISRPTFHQHLRAAERKVLEELFDPDSRTED
jgi:PAS domain S-box-containing protein